MPFSIRPRRSTLTAPSVDGTTLTRTAAAGALFAADDVVASDPGGAGHRRVRTVG